MRGFPYSIEYYLNDEGDAPFKVWLDGLSDITARARIRIRLDRVRLGNLGVHRSVGDGVHELKIDFGPGYRVYFAFEGKSIILLLAGGDKSSQVKDITLAIRYMADYKRRVSHD